MARLQKKSRRQLPQAWPNIRPSLRDGLNAYVVLSLGTGLSCSHRPRDRDLACLAPASGRQDHTNLRPQCRHSSAQRLRADSIAAIASRAPRSWRPRSAPSDERGTTAV